MCPYAVRRKRRISGPPTPRYGRRLAGLGERSPAPAAAAAGRQGAELVVNAAFQAWTASGKIRHASLTGVRDDKDAGEVVRERPDTDVL